MANVHLIMLKPSYVNVYVVAARFMLLPATVVADPDDDAVKSASKVD